MLWWVVLYFIHWPMLVAAIALVSLITKKSFGKRKAKVESLSGQALLFEESPSVMDANTSSSKNAQEENQVNKFAVIKTKTIVIAVIVAVALTAWFGVLSTLIEISFANAIGSGMFWSMFYFRYAAGVPFFLTHIISNAIVLPILVPVLLKTLQRIKR